MYIYAVYVRGIRTRNPHDCSCGQINAGRYGIRTCLYILYYYYLLVLLLDLLLVLLVAVVLVLVVLLVVLLLLRVLVLHALRPIIRGRPKCVYIT